MSLLNQVACKKDHDMHKESGSYIREHNSVIMDVPCKFITQLIQVIIQKHSY